MKYRIEIVSMLFVLLFATTAQAVVLDEDSPALWDTYGNTYDELLDKMYTGGAITTVGDKLWVPWYSTSSSCTVPDLQQGPSCDALVDETHNCMVSDEFSQVGILLSMGPDEARMDEFYNTVREIESSFGSLPAWRIYRNGDTIEPCKDGINGNCDTASDASARIIMALYTGAQNDMFSDSARQRYGALADTLAADMVEHEVLKECHPTRHGDVCSWLAAGSHARNGGMGSWDFAYTGYYPDATIAMLMACANTGQGEYCDIARDFTKNYLQAAKWDGSGFTAPPGRSFRWTVESGMPESECTGNCYPVHWDDADASRAVGMCEALYYGEMTGVALPELDEYCQQWAPLMDDPNKAPIQYYPDGTPVSYQSGYFAQGLQSLFLIGQDKALVEETLRNALSHYSTTTQTWDWSACFGVYTQAFPMRALGTAIGRDASGSVPVTWTEDTTESPAQDTEEPATGDFVDSTGSDVADTCGLATLSTSCSTNGGCTLEEDTTSGTCRTVVYSTQKGDIQVLACEKGHGVEVYRQEYPSGEFTACLGTGCVDQMRGFATTDYVCEATESEDTAETTEDTQTDTQTEADDAVLAGVETLAFGCDIKGGYSVQSDTTSGDCRTVVAETQHGPLKIMACEKGHGVEVYRQEYPSGEFTACIGTGCVDELQGYALI